MSHTPGPWETDDHTSHWSIMTADGGQHIADVRVFNEALSPTGAGDANALLIAAAPDLLKVAKAYEQWEASLIMEDESWRNGLPTLTQAQYDRLVEIQTMRNRAIAKTKGA